MLMFGLCLALMNGQGLLSAHSRMSSWQRVLRIGDLVFMIWLPLAWWASGSTDLSLTLSKEDKFTCLIAICAALVVWLVRLPLSIGLLGIVSATSFLGIGWIRRRRYYGAAAGWFLAGFAVNILAHGATEKDQYSLFLASGGLITAIQGAWEMASYRA